MFYLHIEFTEEEKEMLFEKQELLSKENRQLTEEECIEMAEEMNRNPDDIKNFMFTANDQNKVKIGVEGRRARFTEEEKQKLINFKSMLNKENLKLTKDKCQELAEEMNKTPDQIRNFMGSARAFLKKNDKPGMEHQTTKSNENAKSSKYVRKGNPGEALICSDGRIR